MKLRFLHATIALSGAATAFGQAPEILHYTFDTGAVVNVASPGTGMTETVLDVGFLPSTSCGAMGMMAEAQSTAASIDTNWQVDLGMSDWTVGMIIDQEVGGNGFQYYFGSPTASSFRCFGNGAAGVDGIMLRSPGGDITIPGATALGAPRHVVFVYDSILLEIRGYLDGVLTVTQPQTAALDLNGTAPDFSVMRYTSSMDALNTMEEFRFYRRAITDTEVAAWSGCDVGSSTLGTSYCGSVVNSTGVASTMTVVGSASVAMNNVTLGAADLPNNAFGFFLTSTTAGFTSNPAGSQGNLCLAGAIGRFIGPGQIQQAGSSGEISLTIDLTMVPDPALGLISVLPGDIWFYQTWYRDSVGGSATSNFSDGVEVMFN